MKRLVSLVLILIGALLIYWGYSVQQELGTQIISKITAETPDQVWQYYLTGVVALVVGMFGLWKMK